MCVKYVGNALSRSRVSADTWKAITVKNLTVRYVTINFQRKVAWQEDITKVHMNELCQIVNIVHIKLLLII